MKDKQALILEFTEFLAAMGNLRRITTLRQGKSCKICKMILLSWSSQ
ncbi:MAG: hypothetical protein WD709_03845 [Gammaproteobacteria bacterium]